MLESTVFAQEADLIENQAKVFRNYGVQEVFPQGESVDSELPIRDQTTDKFRDTQEIRSRILEALLYVRLGNGLSIKMAEAINRKVGQFLDDDVKIEDLGLKSLARADVRVL